MGEAATVRETVVHEGAAVKSRGSSAYLLVASAMVNVRTVRQNSKWVRKMRSWLSKPGFNNNFFFFLYKHYMFTFFLRYVVRYFLMEN